MATFLGLELYLEEPNRADDLDEELIKLLTMLDYQTGAVAIDPLNTVAGVNKQYKWVLEGRKAVFDFMSWLDTRKGRLVPFITCTWKNDVHIVDCSKAHLAEKELIIKYVAYTATYVNQPSRSYLLFMKPDKTYFIRKVVSATDNWDGTEMLYLDTKFDSLYAPEDFAIVSYLSIFRLDADTIEIEWINKNAATVSIPLTELPQEVT